jgi:hypothetical protein|tara:strand:+ start:1567 stop:1863 length:297 start_codon:yes stop_codon:yes gene_type:complete
MPSASSPWKNTLYIDNGSSLGYFQIRPVPASPDDVPYVIEPQYNHRPDLLAYDLYDNPKLWWVFAQRNMDIIEDPIYDIESGVEILLPNVTDVKSELG